MVTQDLTITGMHCVDCAHKVEAALKTVPGVEQAQVHYLKRQAQAHVTGTDFAVDQLLTAVRAAGYDATTG